MEEQIRELQEKGIISPSVSPWSAPVVLVKKRTNSGEIKYRFCTDFRGLNAVTKMDVYPLPLINETLEQLGQSRYFSMLDLTSGDNCAQASQTKPDLHKTIRNYSGRESTSDAEKWLDHINGVGDIHKWPS